MKILDFFKNLFSQNTSTYRPSGLAGKRLRLTGDTASELPFAGLFITAPEEPTEIWRTQGLDSKTLDRMSAADLTELMVDLSPEISRALWDFLRMVNPGWEVTALRPGSDEQDERGQELINEFFEQLKGLYGSPDIQINRLILGGFMRGGLFAELVLDEGGRESIDLATPDPYAARFRKVQDPDRGTIWQLGQYSSGVWKDLDSPTVKYIPIDPLPGKPYGRSPMGPAVFLGIFLIGLLHDLRRVVAQQGYPRLDLIVHLEQAIQAMPQSVVAGTAEFEAWVEGVITEITDTYASLEPDDAYVHTDVVEVNRDSKGVTGSDLTPIDDLITALERMITRSLKTMPLMMGINDTATETHANRQWELHSAGIKSIQHLLESLLESLLKIALRAQGLQADVTFRFAELRASEMLRDAQTETMQISNASAKYAAGWISQDEASQEITGSPADMPEPRSVGVTAPVIVEGDGDGEERAIMVGGISVNGR